MRFLFVILAVLALAQCASSEDERFQVGSSPRAFVIIGVAEAAANTSARYDVLWRRVGADGAFTALDDNTAIWAESNHRGTVRVRGIPGEFTFQEVDPGTYALDSVFAVIAESRVNYVANGILREPSRPAFEVLPGEAVYLGIWETDIEDSRAVVRPWRLSHTDLRMVLRNQNEVLGDVRLRETTTRDVACAPHTMNSRTRRLVC